MHETGRFNLKMMDGSCNIRGVFEQLPYCTKKGPCLELFWSVLFYSVSLRIQPETRKMGTRITPKQSLFTQCYCLSCLSYQRGKKYLCATKCGL